MENVRAGHQVGFGTFPRKRFVRDCTRHLSAEPRTRLRMADFDWQQARVYFLAFLNPSRDNRRLPLPPGWPVSTTVDEPAAEPACFTAHAAYRAVCLSDLVTTIITILIHGHVHTRTRVTAQIDEEAERVVAQHDTPGDNTAGRA
jgi:hypothetical protein